MGHGDTTEITDWSWRPPASRKRGPIGVVKEAQSDGDAAWIVGVLIPSRWGHILFYPAGVSHLFGVIHPQSHRRYGNGRGSGRRGTPYSVAGLPKCHKGLTRTASDHRFHTHIDLDKTWEVRPWYLETNG